MVGVQCTGRYHFWWRAVALWSLGYLQQLLAPSCQGNKARQAAKAHRRTWWKHSATNSGILRPSPDQLHSIQTQYARNMSGAEAGVSLHQTHVKLELLELPCLAGAGTSMVDTAHTFHISRYSCTSLNCIQSEVHAVTADHARLKCSTIHRLRPCAL